MKYYIITFGCQMNKSDSERISSIFKNLGFRQSLALEKADLIVVNMCSVRQSAVDRVYGKAKNFSKLKSQNPKLKTILTGCVLKKDKHKLRQKFDYIIEIKDTTKLPEILGLKKQIKTDNYLEIKPLYKNRFSASIPIMTGCDNFCAYCAVPYARGREISRPAEDIICEIKSLIKRGYKEIWLLGQNVNSYKSQIPMPTGRQAMTPKEKPLAFYGASNAQSNPKPKRQKFRIINFPELLKMVNAIPGKFWIRFTSSHPKDFSDELIKSMAESQKITPYLNLPVQAGDDAVLEKMNRSYNIHKYKDIIQKVRKEIPNIAISTDIIVGFPGETKKQFENSVKLFKKIKYDMAYISKYSPRPGTLAEKLKDNISNEEKKRREKVLTDILKKIGLKNNKKNVGKTLKALFDKNKGKNIWLGKTENYKTIKVFSDKNLLGKFVNVLITDALSWGLKGEILSKSDE